MKHLFSKTVIGAVIAVVGKLSDPSILALMPAKAAAVVTGVGMILGAFGVRAAIAKNGNGQ